MLNNKTKYLCVSLTLAEKMFVGFANLHLRTHKGLLAIGNCFLGMPVHVYLPQTIWVSNNRISYGNCFHTPVVEITTTTLMRKMFCIFPFWGIPVALLPAKTGEKGTLSETLAVILCYVQMLLSRVTQTSGCSHAFEIKVTNFKP